MKHLVFAIAILALVFGFGLTLTATWAFVDPYCMPLLSDTARTGAPPSRGEIASVLVFAIAMAAAAALVLRSLQRRNAADTAAGRDADSGDRHDQA